MYIRRDVEKTILDLAGDFMCITVYGQRQCGKTTTITKLFGDKFKFTTMDDYEDRAAAISDPKGFLKSIGWPVIIDEIQKAPVLLDEVKRLIDERKRQLLDSEEDYELMFVLTGSSQFELRRSVSESLAGRTAIIDMSVLTYHESKGIAGSAFDANLDVLSSKIRSCGADSLCNINDIFEFIYTGGMPEVASGKVRREKYYRPYISSYIEKDVRQLVNVSSELQFKNFMTYLAFRIGQEIKYDKFASEIGVDARTLKRWISILESSGVIFLLQPFSSNMTKRLIKSPKVYFMDSGLCADLCKWPNARMISECAMSGQFFENHIISEIVKSYWNSNRKACESLCYYRDVDGREIDLLIEDGDGICPVEIKKGKTPSDPTRNFNILNKYAKVKPGLVICDTDKLRPVNDKAWYCPAGLVGI